MVHRSCDSEKALPACEEPMKRHSRSWSTIVLAITIFLLASAVLHRQVWQRASPAISTAINEHPYRLNPHLHAARAPTTRKYHWRITSEDRRPDGVLKQVYLINDAFPGPIIEARSGDRIVVEVENGLLERNESVSIHYHGLKMKNFNHMDGAAGVTQDAISPGDTFTYDFTIADDQSGTFWYHAHSAVQRADGLFGGLVVHEPSRSREQATPEYLLMIGDWYHRSGDELLGWYLDANSFGMEPVSDSLLVNGRGSFNCEDAVPARPLECQSTILAPLLGDLPNVAKAAKLRFINTGVYSGFSISMLGSHARIVAVDGGNAVVNSPVSDNFGILHPGERVDVMVDGGISSSLSVQLDTTPHKYSNPALTAVQTFPLHYGTELTNNNILQGIELSQLVTSDLKFPSKADATMVLYVVSEKLAHLDYVPHGNINRTFWLPQTPSLNQLDREDFDEHQFVPQISFNAEAPIWVDLVMNNLDEEDHPFHLHGHDFFVMSTFSSSYNWGSYNPYKMAEPPGGPYSTTPMKKDTAAVPRRGYAVFRFQADNPGLWMFHCHVLWHLASGMAMTFDIR